MSFLSRIFGRRRGPSLRLRPESIRSVLVMADEGQAAPAGDPIDTVLRVFLAQNRALYAALFERDLWPSVQLGFGKFARAQRTDPARLAELVRRSHGERASACAQIVTCPLEPGGAAAELTLLTVHGIGSGDAGASTCALLEGPIEPLLDLTNPTAGRDR